MLRNVATEIGKFLRQRRELLGLLQPQLSAIAGVSTRTLQLVEAGKANPSLRTIVQLADALGLDLTLTLKEPATVEQPN
jgi:transcriptional regulator with XRE-family HTH domain